jgi:ABC-type lipoprotein release transport system permease subunit
VNINEVFTLVESVINGALGIGRALLLALSPEGPSSRFEIFSTASFYLTQVPSHVYLREAFMVAFFAVAACAVAALAASRAVSRFRPAEVLRYE